MTTAEETIVQIKKAGERLSEHVKTSPYPHKVEVLTMLLYLESVKDAAPDLYQQTKSIAEVLYSVVMSDFPGSGGVKQ